MSRSMVETASQHVGPVRAAIEGGCPRGALVVSGGKPGDVLK